MIIPIMNIYPVNWTLYSHNILVKHIFIPNKNI